MGNNFSVTGTDVKVTNYDAALQELKGLVEKKTYNLGELVLENGKLKVVNNHASGWFSNDRITTPEENLRVRTAVNNILRQKWGNQAGVNTTLLDAISSKLIGGGFSTLPLTRREVCAYLKMMEGAIRVEKSSADDAAATRIADEKLREITSEKAKTSAAINTLSAEIKDLGAPGDELKTLKTEKKSLLDKFGFKSDSQMEKIGSLVTALKDARRKIEEEQNGGGLGNLRKQYRQLEIRLRTEANIKLEDDTKDVPELSRKLDETISKTEESIGRQREINALTIKLEKEKENLAALKGGGNEWVLDLGDGKDLTLESVDAELARLQHDDEEEERKQASLENNSAELKAVLDDILTKEVDFAFLEQMEADLNSFQNICGKLDDAQKRADKLKELSGQKQELEKKLQDLGAHEAMLPDESLRQVFEEKIAYVFEAEHGVFGHLRTNLDKSGLAGKSVFGHGPSANVLHHDKAGDQHTLRSTLYLQKIANDCHAGANDMKEAIGKSVFGAFAERAHYKLITGEANQTLSLAIIQYADKHEWRISIDDGLDGIKNSVKKFIKYLVEDRLAGPDKAKLKTTSKYAETSDNATARAIIGDIMEALDKKFNVIENEIDSLMAEFTDNNKDDLHALGAPNGESRRADAMKRTMPDFERLLEKMTERVNSFTNSAIDFVEKEDGVDKAMHDHVTSVASKRQMGMQPNEKKDDLLLEIDTLKALGDRHSIDKLYEEIRDLDAIYDNADDFSELNFGNLSQDSDYIDLLSGKMQRLHNKYSSNYSKGDLEKYFPTQANTIRSNLGSLTPADVREQILYLRKGGFDAMLLKIGIDFDELLEHVDVGYLMLGRASSVFQDAMRNMAAKIQVKMASGNRQDLIEAGKLLASLEQMKTRLETLKEKIKDGVAIPEREEDPFAITASLEPTVNVLSHKGDKPGKDDPEQRRVEINDLLVGQIQVLRKFCDAFGIFSGNRPEDPQEVNPETIDLRQLRADFNAAVSKFNGNVARQGAPIDVKREIRTTWKYQKDWDAYTKNLNSIAVQQFSPGLTGGASTFDPSQELDNYRYRFNEI